MSPRQLVEQQQQAQEVRREAPKVALPPSSAPTHQAESYVEGQQLFEKLQWTLNEKAGSSKIQSTDVTGARTYHFESFKYQDPCSRCQCNKYMFVNAEGNLKEFVSNGTVNSKGQGNGSWVDSKATQYFLVGNKLLNEKGQTLGDVALHPSNNKIENGQTFITGSFTFKDNNGCVRCVDASQLCNTGLAGMPAGVVRLGLPPKAEVEVSYALSSRHHLVDTKNPCYQYGVKYSEKERSAYDMKVVPKSEKNKISLNTSEIDKLFQNDGPDKIELKSNNGSTEHFFVRKEANVIYLSKTKDGEAVARIRNIAENPVPPAPGQPRPYEEPVVASHYVLERMLSTKTYFWDCYQCGDLAVAKGGWMEDKKFQVKNDLLENISPNEIKVSPENEPPKEERKKRAAPTPRSIEDPFEDR